jgi:hypothetical protein
MRRCCCKRRPTGCVILDDTFDRSDSTDLGSDWDEKSGNWSIDSNALKEAGTPGSQVVTTKRNPYSSRGVVTVNIMPVDGSIYRIYLNCTSAGSGKLLEIEATTGSVTLRAGSEERTYTTGGGWDINLRPLIVTAFYDYNPTSPYDGFLYLALAHSTFHACVWDNDAGAPISGGRYAALGNGGSTEVQFDDFWYAAHYRDNPECPDIGCWCDPAGEGTRRHYLPWRLRLDYFADQADNCHIIDGTGANLEWDCVWQKWIAVDGMFGTISLPTGTPCTGEGNVIGPSIACSTGEPSDMRLIQVRCCDIHVDPEGNEGCCDIHPNSYSCDPFFLRWDFTVYGTFPCSECGGQGHSGAFYAIATEA